jgi:uncharacterized protein YifE (UPF0438 family)
MSFTIRTSQEIFDSDEIGILKRYGAQFERLMKGERKPRTAEQDRFIRVCRNEVEPQTKYEKVWWKYLRRLEWESDPNNRSASGPPREAAEGFGGSREEYRQMRKAERADFWKRLKE